MQDLHMKYILIIFVLLSVVGCTINEDPQVLQSRGMKPVYIGQDLLSSFSTELARPFVDLGKIIKVGDVIMISERLEGIHVVDNSDPSMPITVLFWNIPGCIDFTVKDSLLYAENSRDLLTFDISNLQEIQLRHTIENIYQDRPDDLFPPDYFGFFECVEPSMGAVVGWEEANLVDPKCRR